MHRRQFWAVLLHAYLSYLPCPTCGETTQQHQAGTNPSGTARRECQHCHRTYTPAPKHHGYDLALRRQALTLYVDGMNFRRIARHLEVNHQTVINWVNQAAACNWVNQAAACLPPLPTPAERASELPVDTVETACGHGGTR